MSLSDVLKGWLDRPELRPFLTPLVSQLARFRGEGVERISYQDGVWIHKTAFGYFAYHQPFVRLDMYKFARATRFNFFWGYTPRNGDVVVDVGAGVGEDALTLSRAVGDQGRVICIEAHPRTYRCLEKLIEYNGLKNVVAVHRAVTDAAARSVAMEESSDYLRNRVAESGTAIVESSTLDQICRELRLDRIDFLKMNIEDAERFAIQGMVETLSKTSVVCVCCHDFLAAQCNDDRLKTTAVVRDFLQVHGITVAMRCGEQLPAYVREQVWGYNEEFMRTAS